MFVMLQGLEISPLWCHNTHTRRVPLGPLSTPVLKDGKFIAAVYDDRWYIGIVEKLDSDNGDIFVKFMHPNGPSFSFFWPKHEDLCWVPSEHILCVVDSPDPLTSRGGYKFSVKNMNLIRRNWEVFCKSK